MNSPQRRKELRVRSCGLVNLLTSNGQSIPGTVRDISPSGISVQSETALEPEQVLKIDCGGMVAHAVVRHCRADRGLFRIGLELLSPEEAAPANRKREIAFKRM